MKLLNSAFQVLIIHMGVDLRGEYRFVPQHLLNGTQIGSPVDHVGGKRVTEGMGTDFLSKTYFV